MRAFLSFSLIAARPWTLARSVFVLGLCCGTATAQVEPRPFAPNEWTYGRRLDESQLRYCVDERDGDWEVARDIADAVAAALLLEPQPHVVQDSMIIADIEELYSVMLEHCDVHMGFKMLPDTYPPWIALTRSYYNASYVFVTADPDWQSLGDVPSSQPIATTIGSRADLRLISYLLAVSQQDRWPRFPMGTNKFAMRSIVDGTAAVALVWEPELWALQRADPAFADLRVIGSAPLPETTEGMAAVFLSSETYLRTAVDQAIEALVADGTIAAILERWDFPATATP